jgi:hypothetical protein
MSSPARFGRMLVQQLLLGPVGYVSQLSLALTRDPPRIELFTPRA